MRSRIYILLLLAFSSLTVYAQCPPADSLAKAVINKKMAVLPPPAQLVLLRKYQALLLKCGAGKDTTYAWLIFQLGWAYVDQQDFLTASQLFSESIAIAAGTPGISQRMLLTRYYFLSTVFDSLRNINAKRRAIDSCIGIAERFGHPEDISAIRCLASRLQYFFDIGEYRLCINDAKLCEQRAAAYLLSATEPKNILAGRGIAENAFHWHVNALLELKQYDDAEALLAGKLEEYRQEKLPNFQALTYAQLAEVHARRGQYDKSLEGFSMALAIYRKSNNFFNAKQTLNNIGEKIWLNHESNYGRALLCFRQALSCRNNDPQVEAEDRIESLNIYRNIAEVFLRQKNFDSAFYYYQRAFDQLQEGAGPATIVAGMQGEFPRYKKTDYLFQLMSDYAKAFREKYLATHDRKALASSLDIYYVTDKLLSRLNLSQFDPDSKLYWRKAAKNFYENAIEACWLAKDGAHAFYFFERSRAVLLSNQVSEQNWLRQEELSALSKLRKSKLETTLAIQALKAGDKTSSVLNDSLNALNEKLYNQAQQVKSGHSLFSQREDSVTTLPVLRQKLLGDETALIEMFAGDSSMFILFMDKEHASIVKIDRPGFDSLQASFQQYLARHDLLNRDFNGFLTVATRLYQTLFQSLPTLSRRLIISPDGSYFPFEALVVTVKNGVPEYLLARQVISYTYSARFLLSGGLPGSAAEGDFLGLAPVTYPASLHLADLPGSDLSVQHIAASLSGAITLTGAEATRNVFMERFATFKVIQLYTHASDSSDRREPVIYFHDAPLYLSELIPETGPATRLIVLSACETGRGRVYEGEGAFTLNRGFAAMGIFSSITNLWAVNNRSAYSIAELFYKFMEKGMPLDLALQKAKLEFMSQGSGENMLPCYWAAPILVGKAESIAMKNALPWKELAAAFLLILIGVLLCIRKFRPGPSPVPGTV